jgi:hypothetical protein
MVITCRVSYITDRGQLAAGLSPSELRLPSAVFLIAFHVRSFLSHRPDAPLDPWDHNLNES